MDRVFRIELAGKVAAVPTPKAFFPRRLQALNGHDVQSEVLKTAAAILARADRGHPADSVLRGALRPQRGLSRRGAREVSRGVFAYHRWLGWLTASTPLEDQLQTALALEERFSQQPGSFSDDELLARSVPAWVKDHVPVSPKWLRALQSPPPLWLRARPGAGARLAGKLGHCRFAAQVLRQLTGRQWPNLPPPLHDALLYCGEEDLFLRPEFHTGGFEIQDLSSQAVGWLSAPQPGETWWDVCAGEGGKTLHLADLMQNKGLIWATDRAAWRLRQLRRRAARAKLFNYRAAVWEGGSRLPTKTKFDGVLVDAPCSGLGTWQRNPQARWTTTPDDVRELAVVQRDLLTRAASAVKPGGKLLLAVCTLTRAETDQVADAFEQQFADFQPLALAHPLKAGVRSARLWFWPQDCGGNGTFVAVWLRRGGG